MSRERIRHWKVTFRSAPLLSYVLFEQWQEEIRIFRWKWLAAVAARLHNLTVRKDFLANATVESYLPGANVIPFISPDDGDREL
jgi:hypothetical protein